MKDVIQSIADNWKLDARLENGNRYFYNYEEVKMILDDKKCYVIGRKGAGKTAICRYISQIKDYNFFSDKLSFKNFPFNDLYELSNERYTQPNQYITLWKYLIYSTVCKLMAQNERISLDIRSLLGKLYPQNDTKQLARRITDWTSAEFGATVLGTGGSVKLTRQVQDNHISWIDKVNLLEDIIMQHCDDSRYYIVFDELDEDYRGIGSENHAQYVFLLTSLFKAVQDVKSTFLDSDVHIMPVVFLRDDIYALINDSDKNKWSDLKIELEWTEDKLKKMLAYRISQDTKEKNLLSFEKAWPLVFGSAQISYGANQSKKATTFEFIAKSTHLRPRDFIRYIQCCCAYSVEKKAGSVSNASIKYEDRAFSNYLKDEIKDELYPLLPEIDTIFQVLSNMRKQLFSYKEFKNEYNKYLNAGTIKERNFDYVLDTLFNYSVIGNQNRFRSGVLYFKYQHTNMTYNKDENIVIHRGLFKALQIL